MLYHKTMWFWAMWFHIGVLRLIKHDRGYRVLANLHLRRRGWEASLRMRVFTTFSKTANHLTLLLAEDTPFAFTNKCLEAFHMIKKALIIQPPD